MDIAQATEQPPLKQHRFTAATAREFALRGQAAAKAARERRKAEHAASLAAIEALKQSLAAADTVARRTLRLRLVADALEARLMKSTAASMPPLLEALERTVALERSLALPAPEPPLKLSRRTAAEAPAQPQPSGRSASAD